METPCTLLIVDDSKADRTIYRRYLAQDLHHHYDVFEANCAERGLELCQHQHFDAILLDFQLPDMSGLQVLDLVQKRHPQVPVVMLTGHGSEQVAVDAMKAGAQEYLIKDQLQPGILQYAVRNVVHQTQLRQQLRKRQEQQHLITQLALQIRQSLELEQTLDTAVTQVRQLLSCQRALVYQFDSDMSGIIVAESVEPGWRSVLGQTVTDTYFQTHGADAYLQGRKQILADINAPELDACYRAELERFEVQANLVIPILIQGDSTNDTRLWGLLVVHQCSAPRTWGADEIQMLEALSMHISIALQHAELLERTQLALKQEQELTAFKSQIISTVSHEYNSPLAAIRLASETLRDSYQKLDHQIRDQMFGVIEQKAEHLSALVKDMLLVNQAELNKLRLKPSLINLADFVSQLLEEHQVIDSHQHELELRVRGDVHGFVGDRGLLRQIFGNLLSNAIKYSPDGGKVRVQLVGQENAIICSIKDEGIGIPADDQKHLFQLFSRASNVNSIAGTGVGLHIVKVAVELHGGTIKLDSRVGEGTQFTIHLPKHLEPSSGGGASPPRAFTP